MKKNKRRKSAFKAVWMRLLVGVFLYSASLNHPSYGQLAMARLDSQEVALVEVLKMLQKEHNLNLVYNASELKGIQIKNQQFHGKKLQEVILEIEKNHQVKIVEKGGVHLVQRVTTTRVPTSPSPSAQVRKVEVKGQVIDAETDEPLFGATIQVKNKNTGQISDMDGNFRFSGLEETDVLVISMLGYESMELVLGNKTDILIRLKSTENVLEEAVVIGYGEVSREKLTSSVTSVSPKEFNRGVLASPEQLLQGKVAGLVISRDGNPNGGANIVLRGASTLREGAAQQPFYVIDGVPGASINLVAPDNIVSIEVLKDASATAIYGSRAANGVIMVTTRKAQPTYGFSYHAYAGLENASNSLRMMTGDELRGYLARNEQRLFPNDNDFIVNQGDTTFVNTNWQDVVTRQGVSQNHTLSYGGGTERATFNASVNYFNQEGIIRGSGRERVIAQFSLDQKGFNDKFKLNFQLTNSLDNQKLVREEVYRQMISYLPTVNVYDTDGSFKENTIDHTSNYFNPLGIIALNQDERQNNTLLGFISAKFDVTKNFNVNVLGSYQLEKFEGKQYQNSASILPINYEGTSYSGLQAGGVAKRFSVQNTRKVLETFFDYTPINTMSHELKILGGYSWQNDVNNDGFQSTNTGFVSDVTGAENLGLGSSNIRVDYGGFSQVPLRIISFYSRLNYSFLDKYLLQVSMRRDGSSAFSEQNRWGNFPAASFGWLMHEEGFLSNQSTFQQLKLRAGYGVTGNSLGFDPLLTVFRFGSSGMYYNNGVYEQAMGSVANVNDDLRWEKTSMLNLGLDFSMFKGKISGTVEWYNKYTSDLIFYYPVSTTLFVHPTMTANVGEISNKGVEFTLQANLMQKGKFGWDVTGNIAHNRNRVEKLSNFEYQLDSIPTAGGSGAGVSGVNTQLIKEGYPIGLFNLYHWAGRNENGVSTFFTPDGGVTAAPRFPADAVLMGHAQPKFTYGLGNNFHYGNWSLNVFIRGVYGNQILNSTRAVLSSVSQAYLRNIPLSAADEPMTDVNNNFYSDRYLESGSFLRVDNATLAYNFPLVNRSHVKNLNVYLTGNNLFVFTKYSGIDPEVNLGGLTPGFDNNNFYPRTRGFMLGMTLDF
ncbi:SusC/RagA family TonB-linked outer membrane protein [Belliella sp. DSM 111904]|uniref:SusC/RagA family TonB-linked outer membrane protein n=1 Tax=Belliella filtrata TaxID=2923435 RepID=A0ABS9UYC6_9BACT|nr:SusC/RagA family TonB-linked outer membrane protein [Belliella filtrata]MCH7409171.1 SusC/RagA family TonB-linked outer membrane protein [Belliella filtrata]